MRPVIDVDEDVRDRVREQAEERGLKMERAWAEAVERGVEAWENESNQ